MPIIIISIVLQNNPSTLLIDSTIYEKRGPWVGSVMRIGKVFGELAVSFDNSQKNCRRLLVCEELRVWFVGNESSDCIRLCSDKDLDKRCTGQFCRLKK